jgi:hypothetical protein
MGAEQVLGQRRPAHAHGHRLPRQVRQHRGRGVPRAQQQAAAWCPPTIANGLSLTDPPAARRVWRSAWASWTLPLGWPVAGIWPPDSDGTDVNAVDRAPRGDTLATADVGAMQPPPPPLPPLPGCAGGHKRGRETERVGGAVHQATIVNFRGHGSSQSQITLRRRARHAPATVSGADNIHGASIRWLCDAVGACRPAGLWWGEALSLARADQEGGAPALRRPLLPRDQRPLQSGRPLPGIHGRLRPGGHGVASRVLAGDARTRHS